jgi:hypothetical protein
MAEVGTPTLSEGTLVASESGHLPSGWDTAVDPTSGERYYFHTEDPLNTVTWQHPGGVDKLSDGDALQATVEITYAGEEPPKTESDHEDSAEPDPATLDAPVQFLGRGLKLVDLSEAGNPKLPTSSEPPPKLTVQLAGRLNRILPEELMGADTDELRSAMHTLWRLRHDPLHRDVPEALRQTAIARRKPISEITSSWHEYIRLLKSLESSALQRGLKIPQALVWLQRDFMASSSQLRYGLLVGEALGIDPIFGALLNPTGGLVGPGNLAVDLEDSAAGLHGAVHDAAGYLFVYHGIGPGYNYLGLEDRDTASPLAGQISGIGYWRVRRGSSSLDAAGHAVVTGLVETLDEVKEAKVAVARAATEVLEPIKKVIKKVTSDD